MAAGDLLILDIGEYALVDTQAGSLPDVDLGEYARILIAYGAMPELDIGEYTVTPIWGGLLPQIDLGEYPRVIIGYGTLPVIDFGEYAHTTLWGGVLPQIDLGEYERVLTQYGTLPFFDIGEYTRITIWGGVLPFIDLGEYSYVWLTQNPEGDIFPAMVGIDFLTEHQPIFTTLTERVDSGREVRTALMPKPLWYITLRYNLLRDLDLTRDFALDYARSRLQGFFQRQAGSLKSFLYLNPRDYLAADEPFGTGDGIETSFQLTRTYGAGGFDFTEDVKNVARLDDILIDGVSVNGHVHAGQHNVMDNPCTVDQYGVATFRDPPGNGLALTWSGEFYYRCRFQDDSVDFVNLWTDTFSINQLTLVGSPGNFV